MKYCFRIHLLGTLREVSNKCRSVLKFNYSENKFLSSPTGVELIREFKQRRRRRRGRRLVKNEFIFHKQNSRLFRSARYANGSINVFKPNMQRGVQFQIEIRKISRRRPRSIDDAELGNFTLLLC